MARITAGEMSVEASCLVPKQGRGISDEMRQVLPTHDCGLCPPIDYPTLNAEFAMDLKAQLSALMTLTVHQRLETMLRTVALLTALACVACEATPAVLTSSPPPASGGVLPALTPTFAPMATEAPLAALVNGQPIYMADYEREVRQYQADMGETDITRARGWILEWMITEVLIEQAATTAGIVISDADVDAQMQQIIAENGGEEAFQAKLAARGETYEDAWHKQRREMIVAAMNQHISDSVPEVAEQVHARHILVDTQEEAERILAQLHAGADFAALAQAYSQDANTRDSGGDLGFFPRGLLLTAPEVEEVAFALQPGQFSGVFTSPLGYHIVQVVERDPARPIGPDDRRLLQERALQEWVGNLWAQATIQTSVDVAP